MVICAFSPENAGELSILHGNAPAAFLFGYTTQKELEGLDVKSLMPKEVATGHSEYVNSYYDRAKKGSSIRQHSVMGNWRDLNGVKKNGELIPIKVNIADVKNDNERFFVGIFIDRSADVERQMALELAIKIANEEKVKAEEACAIAESSLLKEKKLTGQISLLRQIFGGTVGLVAMLGCLIILSWWLGAESAKDSLAMIERVLLVMTGILGSAMASVFDSRDKDGK